MTAVTAGSCCTGYGGLEDAAETVLGPLDLRWVAENDPGAAAICAHTYPGVPNLGDITRVDWAAVARVLVMLMGFPCQDISLAGPRGGMLAGSRSGLWYHLARAIAVVRPRVVIIENVRSITSARADSNVELCPGCLGNLEDKPALRALGAVSGDLADLGFRHEWRGLRASDVGACHPRFREFILAWQPARVTGYRAAA